MRRKGEGRGWEKRKGKEGRGMNWEERSEGKLQLKCKVNKLAIKNY